MVKMDKGKGRSWDSDSDSSMGASLGTRMRYVINNKHESATYLTFSLQPSTTVNYY
jgi:hypothetical protein